MQGNENIYTPEEKPSKKKRKLRNTWPMLCIKAYLILIFGATIGGLFIVPIRSLGSAAAMDKGFLESFNSYFIFLGIWVLLFALLLCFKGNRPMLQVFGRKARGNNAKGLLFGLALGFAMNAFCVLVAVLHKDIHIRFEAFRPPETIALFAAILIQSSAEEFIFRGYLHQKILQHYNSPLLAILLSTLMFSLGHASNPGVTFLSLSNIVLIGILFSLLVHYMDSLWAACAAHTAWNFTQNILFGLPNSGHVLPFSIFKLDAATATDSFAYSVSFGIEGTVMASLVILLATAALWFWGRKYAKPPMDVWAKK